MNDTTSQSAVPRIRNRPDRKPPGPRGFPFLGHALGFARDPLAFLLRISRDHGDIVEFRLPGQRICLLNHPETIESVLLAKQDITIKDTFTRELSVIVGNGLLTSEGAFWRRQRRLAQPAFRPRSIETYFATVAHHAERAASDLVPGAVRDVHRDMMRLALDIVAETLFGADVGPAGRQISQALDFLTDHFSGAGALVPVGLRFRARKALASIDEVVHGLIAERRRNPSNRNDLLSTLLRATEEGEAPMTDRQLRDEVVTLLLAGHETTALAVTFALYLLGKHPEASDRLHAELSNLVGGEPLRLQDLQRLEFLDGVVRESLRLYPPAWAIGRETTTPLVLEGVEIAPKTQLWMTQWVVHRDPRFFDDPSAYRPERWTREFVQRLHRFAYFPFGGGKRVCIGNSFAMMSASVILASMLRRVRFLPATESPLELLPSVTLRPKSPVLMRVERRRP